MSLQEEEDGADLVEHDIHHDEIFGGSQSNFIRVDINSLKLHLEKQQRQIMRVPPNRINSGTQTESPRRISSEIMMSGNKENNSSAVVSDPNILTAWMSDDEKDMISRRVPK